MDKTLMFSKSFSVKKGLFIPLADDGVRGEDARQGCQVPKNKKAKFGHKHFKKGRILKWEKGKIYQSNSKFHKMLYVLLKFRGLKRYNLLRVRKKAKNCQMSKSFYF
jgi:hypothetical protein